ncbi:MAG TPA: hypothetical protein VJO14_03815, partial [Bacteroidota bacterium]|nr:hypothetical protein [Bacteroidota bacterium]
LVLRASVAPSGGSGPVAFIVRIPSDPAQLDDLADGAREIDDRMRETLRRWNPDVPPAPPGGVHLAGAYGDFIAASVRIIDQLRDLRPDAKADGVPPGSRVLPDVVDEHFLMESEMYSGREKEARARLENVWRLENDRGLIVGAGGESNMKEMAAAVYSLCRHAELGGDWKYFDELYPDAYNALNSLREIRDREAVTGSESGKRNLLPPGSLGPGWEGDRPELTNTLWTLMALKAILEVSDRLFLPKKSEIREFYGQLRLAFMLHAREGLRDHPGGFGYLPMTIGPAAEALRPQSAQGTMAAALTPGLLFRPEDAFVGGFRKLMEAVTEEDVPVGTGPGSPESYRPEDAALMGQYAIWANLPELARKYFAGFLNHASPVFTWSTAQELAGPDSPGSRPPGGPGLNLRATAECIRYLRHMMVFEDQEVLRLLDGVAEADLTDYKPLEISDTPTRWGRVSIALEPVDKRTWTIRYSRVPVNQAKAPPLKSVELPRVLAPNFRFDTVTGSSAIKNGPRVIVDGASLKWEATLRNLMR